MDSTKEPVIFVTTTKSDDKILNNILLTTKTNQTGSIPIPVNNGKESKESKESFRENKAKGMGGTNQNESDSNSSSRSNSQHNSQSKSKPNTCSVSAQKSPKQPPIQSKPLEGEHYDHRWVDLGLPSGLKWASLNLGTTLLNKGGRHLAWGEIRPKFEYNPDNYNPLNIYRIAFSSFTGDEDDDPAVEFWGGWGTPTKEEFEELINCCSFEYVEQRRIKGVVFRSKNNGQSIFIPAAGCRMGQLHEKKGEEGFYWTSTSAVDMKDPLH